MKAHGAAQVHDDCFAKLDEAFARLEQNVESSPATTAARRRGAATDLSDFDEAFSSLDPQLGVALPNQASVAPRGNLALVPPAPAAAVAEPPCAVAATPVAADDLWRRPTGVGTPLERLVETMQNLLWLHGTVHSPSPGGADRIKFEQIGAIISDARQLCADFDLQTARVRADFMWAVFEEDRLDLLAAEISELVRHIRHDLKSCSIWPVSKERTWAFSLALGPRAQRAFASARADVAEGGRCAAFGFHSASVFHMLRAATYGMRALATATRGKRAAGSAPDWSTTVAAVEARLAEARRWQASDAKTAATAFYGVLVNDSRTLYDAECRMASGGSFDEHHAFAIVHAARGFLTRLAEHVVEQQERPLTKKDFAVLRKA